MKNHPYKKHLSRDKKLKSILDLKVKIPKKSRNVFMDLVSSIIAQQLSTKVARVIEERFLLLFNQKAPVPEEVLSLSLTDLRSIGLSERKAQYIHNVAQFFLDHQITSQKLRKLTDEEIIELFCQIKGVGRWTVEMILIFSLKREDVLALDDLGIQKAMISLFKLPHLSKKDLRQKMHQISLAWSPYRTYAGLYLWESLK